MIFEPQEIPGTFLIKPEAFSDERGLFRRHYCQREFSKAGIEFSVAQGNISENFHKHTLRGFHFQKPPHGESKLLSCLFGKAHNVIIDLRADSPMFHQWRAIEISAESRESLFVPQGCANAFLTLADNTIIHYYMGNFFTNAAYTGIRYDDPFFSITWPHLPEVISHKDANLPDFNPGN